MSDYCFCLSFVLFFIYRNEMWYAVHANACVNRFDCITWQRCSHGVGILGSLYTISVRSSGERSADDRLMVHNNHDWHGNCSRSITHMVEETSLCKSNEHV